MSALVTGASPFLSVLAYAVLVIVALLLIAFLLYSALVLRAEYRFRGFPGPKRTSFILGNGLLLVAGRGKLSLCNCQTMHLLVQTHGPVFWMRFLWMPFIVACSREIVKELLLNSHHTKPFEIYKSFQTLYGTRFLGHGLVSETEHEKWFHRRAILNPAFRRKYLIGMMEQFNEGAEMLCQKLMVKADGKTEIAMLDDLSNITLDVIAKVGFSLNTNAITDPDCPFPSAITTMLHGMQHLFDTPFTQYDMRSKARKLRRDVTSCINLVRNTGLKCIQERIRARKQGDHVPIDMLTMILEASNDLTINEDFRMDNMLDEFVTLFIAGQETTSNLLAFTIQQLGRHPNVAKKLRAEVDEVLGQKPTVEYDDLAKLEYMMKVLKETLRLYPPVGGTTRRTAHPIQYKHFTIPTGSVVSVVTSVMSRMEEYFDDPLLFNPDRFDVSDEEGMRQRMYAYFPFSLGQRSCIGQQFALIEARVLLSKLLQRFEFRLEQGQRTTIIDQLTSKPLDKCKNYVTIRP
ncbi:cholesterol 24-hydroxylase-like [Diadema antillarum]|uniref:cholesterol 24-hydroxylase-like n=1 Tax=Diadema antillarum TaxID=105358 RepID=UPI003A8B463E